MKLEEALLLLREGKKIRHPTFEDDVYLLGCYVSLNAEMFGIPKEDFEQIKSRGMSIVKMKGDKIHSDMRSKFIFPQEHCKINPYIHTYPQINLLLLMCEDWEIIK